MPALGGGEKCVSITLLKVVVFSDSDRCLWAAFKALLTFEDRIVNKEVLLKVENVTTVLLIKRKGGTRNRVLLEQATIMEWAQSTSPVTIGSVYSRSPKPANRLTFQAAGQQQ